MESILERFEASQRQPRLEQQFLAVGGVSLALTVITGTMAVFSTGALHVVALVGCSVSFIAAFWCYYRLGGPAGMF